MKVAGHAMLYTLMILLLVGSLMGMYIWHYALQGSWLNHQQRIAHHHLLLEAGIYTYLSEAPRSEGRFTYYLEGDSCVIASQPWGLFQVVQAHVDSQTRSCLVGEKAFPVRKHSLWLQDQRSPLALAGKARLRGELFLPQAGLRTAYIANRGFEGSQLFEGNKRQSEGVPPGFRGDKCEVIQPLCEQLLALPSNGEKHLLTDAHIQRSWQEKPYDFWAQGSLVLGKVHLEGAVRIFVKDTLWIGEAAKLNHTLLVASHIEVSPGFKGRIQAVALGSMTVGEGAYLAYPSGIMVAPQVDKTGSLTLRDDSMIEGYLIASRGMLRGGLPQRADLVSIAETATVWGTIDTDLPIDLRGQVMGSVNARQFVVSLPSQRYKHALIDGRIDRVPLDRQFVGPMVYGGGLFRVIEWW